ncbi:CaiB/BaiF CoA transferase family protein [Paraburkholderia sp. GAS42]|uniref:CaiB/BaiF CoA transferase family protein n=1 Tax=Paraburkholderia sp. GAS42 TaxID=3035135 RepID=UPI003D24B2AE
MGALHKLRVLDFTQMMTGPMATMMLGDFGADVIKIEAPEGDPFRASGEVTLGGDGVFFLSMNRNKRGVVLDLKTGQGRETVRALAAEADVLVENFRPGLAEKLGLGCDALRALNPRLIYCSITGFGREGPDRDRPALDQVVQAESGLMQITGTAQSGPLKTGFPFSDLVTALLATTGILNAVIARYETGVGQRIDLSMLDASIFSIAPRDVYYAATGKTPPRTGNEHWDIVPNNTYATRDGREVMVISINDKFWAILARALGLGEMAADPLFATKSARLKNRQLLDKRVAAAFRERTLADWEAVLREAGAIYGAVRTWDEVFNDPHVAGDLVHSIEHPAAGPLAVLKNPLRFSATPSEIRRPPPRLGEHTDSVLANPSAAWDAC